MPLAEGSQSKTAFIRAAGHYKFTEMPFVLVNAPAVLQRIVGVVLGSWGNTTVVAYMNGQLMHAGMVAQGLETFVKCRESYGSSLDAATKEILLFKEGNPVSVGVEISTSTMSLSGAV